MSAPPTFAEAKNKRQKARAAGLDPNYWYGVALSKDLKPEQVKRATFWGTHVAVYRDDRGNVHALEDRCPHRHLPLSIGQVEGEKLRFSGYGAPLPESAELISQLDAKLVAAEAHAEEEAKRAEEEAKRAEDAEGRLAEALAELAKLRGGADGGNGPS